MDDMESEVKARIAVMAVDVLFTRGLPALAKMINTMNNNKVVTNEDIDKIGADMKRPEFYFE